AAPDEVFPEPRLALVDTRRGPARQRRALIFYADTLLVERVARLVQRAEERIAQVVFLDAVRDPHVPERELGAERMVRLILAPALEIVAKAAGHVQSESELLCLGEG